MKKLLIAACLLSTGLAAPVFAANATHPYQNCDRKVDNCGPTGDERTDQLNAQQLGGSGQVPPADATAPVPTDQGTSR